jgi:hypothetical protein
MDDRAKNARFHLGQEGGATATFGMPSRLTTDEVD